MAFIAVHESDGCTLQLLHIQKKGLVRHNNDGPRHRAATSNSPLPQLSCKLLLRRLPINRKWRNGVRAEPLGELVGPIPNQARRTRDNSLLDCRLSRVRRLLQQGPQQRYALQRLPEAHFVCHDAAIGLLVDHTRDTLVHKPDALDLVRAQDLGQLGVDNDRYSWMLAFDFLFDSEDLGQALVDLRGVELSGWLGILAFLLLGLVSNFRFIIYCRIVKNDGELDARVVLELGNI